MVVGLNTIRNGATYGRTSFDWDPTGRIATLLASDQDGTTTDLAGLTSRPETALFGPVIQPVAVDHQGSVLTTEATRNLGRASTYDPWGQPAGPDSFTPSLGYRGELQLNKLLYLRSRNYEPSVGDFTTRDSLNGVDGTTTVANAYHYADNDPLNKTDPLGLRPVDAEFWGDAKPTTMAFWFPVDERHQWLGEIHIAGFIPQAETSMTPLHGPGPRFYKGDDRSFTAGGSFIDPNRNRFFVSLDFSTGRGFAQVNPTCRAKEDGFWVGGDCSSARPIVYGIYDGNNILDPKYDKNYMAVQRSTDTYRFAWSVVQADQGFGQDLLRPRADGKIDFRFVEGGSLVEPSWSGDCFPSIEVMHVAGGTTQVIGRVSDAGAETMVGVVTNIYNLLGRC